MERELAFRNFYLTWNEEAQGFEDDLQGIRDSSTDDVAAIQSELDGVQERIDAASLNLEEWNILYRLRLQIEQDVTQRAADRRDGNEVRERGVA